MGKHIVIIQGHPDPGGGHLCHALSDAYAAGASEASHTVERIGVAALGLPLVQNKAAWETEPPPPSVVTCQDAIRRANHLVVIFPLWLGAMPAGLKGFFEQVFRPGFALAPEDSDTVWRRLLTGRSARIIVTMGMPAVIYRWYFGAHSLKSLERNILRFAGIKPIRETLIGSVGASDENRIQQHLERVHAQGRAGT